MEFTDQQIQRYSRHIILNEVGGKGQVKLSKARVLLIGAGGLGSPAALYLAAAGIGTIGLVDGDVVDLSNLQRQILHTTATVGVPKVESGRRMLSAINPDITINTYQLNVDTENILGLVADYDIVLDGSDNFTTRFLVNDACFFAKKTLISASMFRFEGQLTSIKPHAGFPCYRCLYPEPPPPGEVPSCAEGGVLGILPGLVGLIQATEAIKLILGRGRSLVGRLLLFNALEMTFDELKIRRNPRCPVCGDAPTIKELIDYDQFCGVGRGNEKSPEATMSDITVKELKARLDRKDKFTLVDVREPNEFEIARIPGARLLPLSELPSRAHELDTADDIVVHCKSGVRSLKAIAALKQMGFKKLTNVKGGILAWSDEVDPAVPKY